MKARKILIAEDNADTLEILNYRIKAMGSYEILSARNGKEALEIAEKSKPDLIIMDLKMPVLDGWETTKRLRQSNWGKATPIIALTAQALGGDEEKALAAGCNDYLSKPVTDYNLLRKKIERLLGPQS